MGGDNACLHSVVPDENEGRGLLSKTRLGRPHSALRRGWSIDIPDPSPSSSSSWCHRWKGPESS